MKSTWCHFGLLMCLASFGSGCSGRYGQRVPKELVSKLPYESRIELLEAENELAVAIDRVDEADSEILRTRQALRRARSRLSAAHDEVGEAGDSEAKAVARLAVDEGKARVEMLHRRQRVNVESKEIEELALQCAVARFELARLTVARKAKVQGSERFVHANFEKQIARCDADLTKARAGGVKARERLAQAKQEWDAKKEALAAKSFDARATPFVE
jgi:hypothetical protein